MLRLSRRRFSTAKGARGRPRKVFRAIADAREFTRAQGLQS
eukprot:gene283-3_t